MAAEAYIARESSVNPINGVSNIKERGRQERIDYINESLRRIKDSIKRHRELSAWGNVESRQRVRELNARQKVLRKELEELK